MLARHAKCAEMNVAEQAHSANIPGLKLADVILEVRIMINFNKWKDPGMD